MHILYVLLVTFFAGMGAGLGTGFAGMSAAAVISPMLITFLGMDPYMAVGIALSSDVLASAVSAYTYHKNKNLDVKNGLIMMASVLAFTVVGSWLASLVPSQTMGGFSVFMTFLLGIKFIVKPVMTTKEAMQGVSAKPTVRVLSLAFWAAASTSSRVPIWAGTPFCCGRTGCFWSVVWTRMYGASSAAARRSGRRAVRPWPGKCMKNWGCGFLPRVSQSSPSMIIPAGSRHTGTAVSGGWSSHCMAMCFRRSRSCASVGNPESCVFLPGRRFGH